MKKVALLVAASLMAPAAAFAHQAGDILVRGGAVMVSPTTGTEDTLDVQSNTQLGLTLSYMVTDNWGVELLAATPFSHSVELGGTEVAKVKHLPPSLMAQYYFGNAQSKVRPYIGAGVNYTFFFDEDGKGPLSGTNVSADDSWGLAAQAGVDMAVTENLFVNGSVWYMDIDTDVTVNGVHVDNTNIDPIGLMVGLGYRF
ncbi:OmpW family outer membrane protein [Oceanimonas baumannii]|uniref:Outer membrane protein n=1 Tax=Oceanimonas baumannii TaxID=129578 RepID=A0A235C9J9_9GAMM|nr:OmpW family outer membrane protein [Oceanimonas baumannii]OYD21142.1 outer membrane protein OmpW [Oceanimonas baumannii]TDW54390.1 outer membrane protein [Oceanimonas baumannii]